MRVLVIKPFWRYCVNFIHQTGEPHEGAAMPFYTRRRAVEWAKGMSQEDAMRGCVLQIFKKAWLRRAILETPVAEVVVGKIRTGKQVFRHPGVDV
jgi:hypothetical protein